MGFWTTRRGGKALLTPISSFSITWILGGSVVKWASARPRSRNVPLCYRNQDIPVVVSAS